MKKKKYLNLHFKHYQIFKSHYDFQIEALKSKLNVVLKHLFEPGWIKKFMKWKKNEIRRLIRTTFDLLVSDSKGRKENYWKKIMKIK